MITRTHQNLFTVQADALIDVVSIDAAMGFGLPKEFRRRFPVMYQDFKERQKMKLLEIGKPYPVVCEKQTVLVFPTHGRYGSARLTNIARCMDALAENYSKWHLCSAAISSLSFAKDRNFEKEIFPLIQSRFSKLTDFTLIVCE